MLGICLGFATSALQSTEGPLEHVTVFGSTSGSVRSTSPNIQATQPILSLQQSQATAFVQPTQQQATQEPATSIMEAVHSSQMERPSTSTAVFGTGTKNYEEIANICGQHGMKFDPVYI